MTLSEYLKEHDLITDVYDINLDLNYFKSRFLYRYAKRTMRDDLTADEIANAAQNVVDINKDFLKNIFDSVVNPFVSRSEKIDFSEESDTSKNGNFKNTEITTNNVDGEYNGGGSITDNGTATTESVNNNTNKHYVNAFNSSADDNLSTKDTGETTDKATQTNNATQTRNILDKTTTKSNGNKNTNGENNETGKNKIVRTENKIGFEFDTYSQTFKVYVNAYDFLINLISQEILEIIQG